MKKTKHITIDATNKLIFQGFPVLLFGTTDRRKHFHPFGIAITSNEAKADFQFVFESLKNISCQIFDDFDYSPSIVIADGDKAISNGFQAAFPLSFDRRVMCFAHVIRRIDAQLKSFVSPSQKAIKEQIRNDILFIIVKKILEI